MKIAQFTFNYFSIDIRKCEGIDHADVIFRTCPRATYIILAGDLVPAGTTLMTRVLHILVKGSTRVCELLVYHLTYSRQW